MRQSRPAIGSSFFAPTALLAEQPRICLKSRRTPQLRNGNNYDALVLEPSMLITMPTGTSTIFGIFPAIRKSSKSQQDWCGKYGKAPQRVVQAVHLSHPTR
jgi:hypothetical protein